MAVKMVNAIPRTIPTVAAFSAMCPLLVPSRRIFMGNNRRRCVSYFTLSLATLSQLTGQPRRQLFANRRHLIEIIVGRRRRVEGRGFGQSHAVRYVGHGQ